MTHTDPDILALRALGETAGTARDGQHAETCAHCRAELARLTEIVRLARAGGPPEPLERRRLRCGTGSPPRLRTARRRPWYPPGPAAAIRAKPTEPATGPTAIRARSAAAGAGQAATAARS